MGGFFPKVDEKYGDGDREYNWWRLLRGGDENGDG